jgi:hypothetical protein
VARAGGNPGCDDEGGSVPPSSQGPNLEAIRMSERPRSFFVFPSGNSCHQLGWDCCITEPNTAAEMRCRVCGEAMVVRRGVIGPTGSAHAQAIANGQRRGTRHDAFSCVFSGEAWHRQALALKMEAARTPSRELERLLLDEAERVVRAGVATKEV